MNLSELEGRFLTAVCSHINHRVHTACDFNFIDKTEGLLNITGSHVNYRSGDISNMVVVRGVVTTGHQQKVISTLSNSSSCDHLECVLTFRVIQSVFSGARDSEWQWRQLGHMQICTLPQTHNHASTPPLRLDSLPAAQPTASNH